MPGKGLRIHLVKLQLGGAQLQPRMQADLVLCAPGAVTATAG